MSYSRYSLSVFIQLLIVVCISVTLGMVIRESKDLNIALFLIIILVILAGILLYNVHRVVRDTAFFFEALRNEDGSLHFPVQTGSRSLNFLHQELNQLARTIEDIRRQSVIRENYFQALIQHSATGLIALNGENEIDIINQKAAEYAGIPPESFPGILKTRNSELCQYLMDIKPGETRTYHTRREDLPLHLSLWATTIKIGEQNYKLISLQDIQPELNAKELESWQKLIRVLTHEIMNSIAPITSLTASLKNYFKQGADPVSSGKISDKIISNTILGLDTIEERGSGLLRFVESYRKLYKIPQPVCKPIEVNEWLSKLKMLMSEKLSEHQIEMEILAEKNQILVADETLLSHAMINLLTNAVDALSEIVGPRKIRINSEKDGKGRMIITISNNGPMIPKDIQDRIFIPFYTTKEHGSGIGLNLCRQIVHLHGGRIDLISEKTITSFIIVL